MTTHNTPDSTDEQLERIWVSRRAFVHAAVPSHCKESEGNWFIREDRASVAAVGIKEHNQHVAAFLSEMAEIYSLDVELGDEMKIANVCAALLAASREARESLGGSTRRCVHCDARTEWLCSDCRIDRKAKEAVCENCRSLHKTLCHAAASSPVPAAPKSLLREPVDVVAHLTTACPTCKGPLNACDCMPPLVVTRDGVPCENQKAALEEFRQACAPAQPLQPTGEQEQTWCDHCSADLNSMKHVLCERCYREFAASINTRETLRAAILDWLVHRCNRAPVCGNCIYCRVAKFVQSLEPATTPTIPSAAAMRAAEEISSTFGLKFQHDSLHRVAAIITHYSGTAASPSLADAIRVVENCEYENVAVDVILQRLKALSTAAEQ